MSTGGRLNLSYEVFEISKGSRFVRTLDYSFHNPILRIVDFLVINHLMRRKSARSLQRLTKTPKAAHDVRQPCGFGLLAPGTTTTVPLPTRPRYVCIKVAESESAS